MLCSSKLERCDFSTININHHRDSEKHRVVHYCDSHSKMRFLQHDYLTHIHRTKHRKLLCMCVLLNIEKRKIERTFALVKHNSQMRKRRPLDWWHRKLKLLNPKEESQSYFFHLFMRLFLGAFSLFSGYI